ncbi:SpaA isopeptide-forming pilin-related protein [Jiangella alkaliphila]|uniref:SpaA isopeptide-forming pilin-related protein n=1 Tax=Jiangella alkaliphila TaxID=419479 RepID=UPI00128C6D50|nr:SpaA isopeptide-forming pilin-related protein [Jiangella alkaliphila]
MRRPFARAVVGLLLVAGSVTAAGGGAVANQSGNELVGGFEIDGNVYEGFDNATTATGPGGDPVDWGSEAIFPAQVDVVHDPLGGTDATVFDRGSKEANTSTWNDDGSAAAPGKGDIGDAYLYDRVHEGDEYLYVGWERGSDNGSVRWYVELNQLPNTVNGEDTVVPDRSVGDLRLSLFNLGSRPLELEAVQRWNGTAWVATGDVDDFALAVNDSAVTTPSDESPLGREQFVEIAFDLTALLGDTDDCGFAGFSSLWIRSAPGASPSAELKDYVTGAVDTPARCGPLTIEKHDAEGEPLGGATFTVEPNPVPGAADPDSLTIADNDENDADPADGVITIDPALPGEYTITETAPPPGYLLDDEPQDVTLDEFGAATVTFVNRLGSLAWSKLDAESGDPLCCATFTVVGTGGAAEGVSITVVDNGENDADPAEGAVLVEDLPTGTYTVTETVAPTGYDLAADSVRDGIVIDAENPDVVVENAFEDPRLPSELTVRKLDADTQEPLAGATFELYLDDPADGVQDAPGGDTLIGECTTGDDGTCAIGDLGWGTYYWYEAEAPAGYELPADRFSGMTTIGRDNAGGELPVATLTDRQIRSSIEIVKTDASTGEELAGATFVVRLDDGDGEFDPGDDTVVDPPGEVTTDATGTVTVGGLLFGDYWVEETGAPTGYELPDDAVQGPVTIGPDNAGDTVAVTFEDEQLLTDLSVLKLDGGSDSAGPLAGATFELYLDDGDVLVGDCTTGDDGLCTVTGLGFGTYYWLETAAPQGYDLPDDPYSAPVTITAENAGTELEPLTFYNPRKPGSLAVLKVDDTDDAPLAGATFELHADDADGAVVGTCTTADDGTCTLGDLGFGTYVWVETAAPEGYALPDDVTSDPLVVDESTAGDDPTPFEFRDPRLWSELSVLKVDAVDGTALAGAEFELRADDADGAVVGECTTGDDGTCTIGDLDFGTYVWVEIAAPQGYALPDDTVSEPVVIDASNAGGELTQVVVHDPRLLSELSAHKVAEDTGESLPGAVFDLVLADGDLVVGTCTTGDDGLCSVGDLDFGDYYWVEITAPEGYLLPDDVTSEIVSITAENAGTDIAAVTFVDPPAEEPGTPTPTPTPSEPPSSPEPSGSPSPTPGEPDLPDTGLGGPLGLVAMVAAAGLAVGAALRWRSRRA